MSVLEVLHCYLKNVAFLKDYPTYHMTSRWCLIDGGLKGDLTPTHARAR